jgi:hypothetical protein
MVRTLKLAALGLVLGSLLVLVGCFNSTGPGTDNDKDYAPPIKADQHNRDGARDAKPGEGDHAHKPGQHGGILVSIGTDSYHAEAVFEKGGTLRLYLLGKDETRIQEADVQTLNGFIKATGDPEAEPFALEADPTQDDTRGMTSRFAGKIPARLVGKHLEVTIPNLRIGNERFRISFKSAAEPGEAHSSVMPPPAENERDLYLTPGGKYTAADIQANGNTSARVKYQGVKTEHNDHPQPGDKICPISKTKANPKITWIVGGKVYEFCCPPCVDEFVSTAKEKPEQIHNPESYRKQ